MIGTYVIIAVLLLFPVGFLASTTIAAGVIGWALQSNAESANEDSELLERAEDHEFSPTRRTGLYRRGR